MGSLLRDLRYSLRKMLRRPVLSAIVVLSMALGIGASTIVYGIIKGALLTPFNFPELGRLAMVWVDLPTLRTTGEVVSGPEYLALAEQTDLFEAVGAGLGTTFNMAGEGEPERIRGEWATPSLFTTLGIRPILGRGLVPEDSARDAPPVLVMSHSLWQRRFGGDPEIVDTTLNLNGRIYTVVGVLPPRFRYGRADLWGAMWADRFGEYDRSRRTLWTTVRLRDGVSLKQANAALEVLSRQLEAEYVGDAPEYEDWKILLEPLREYRIGEVKTGLYILAWTVALVVVIVCANVANLLLARAFSREREIATRITLGAGRGRMVRLLFTESMVLVVLGGAFGLLFTFWGLEFLSSMIPPQYLPAEAWFGVDVSALAVILAVTVSTGILVGLFPALQTSRPNLQESLKEGVRGYGGGRRGRFLLNALVVAEVALTLVLLIGLGLMIRGFVNLEERDTGCVAEGVLTFHVAPSGPRYRGAERVTAFYEELDQRLETIAGVEAAGSTRLLPLEEYIAPTLVFDLEGRAPQAAGPGAGLEAVYLPSTPGYFRAMRIPLEKGRLFTAQDRRETMPVAVVNQAFVRRFFSGDEDPLAKRLMLGPPEWERPWRSIVGVVRDVTQRRLTEEVLPAVYTPHLQTPRAARSWMRVTVRSSLDAASLVRAVREKVRDLDPNLPVFEIVPMAETVNTALGGWRLVVIFLTGFAMMALLLSAIGLYGVISYSVSQRTHEIGVRMAMGARRSTILKMILGQGALLTIFGLVLGAVGAGFL
ncbi:MAG: ABC transporter permease, partial [bacterium]|nr:ABC transporter permease [bacterium]